MKTPMLWLACAASLVLAVAQDTGNSTDRNARPQSRDAVGGRGPRGGPAAGRSAGRDFESAPQAKDDAEARTVTAPISGVITALSVENGDTAGGPGSAATATMV